MAALSFAEKTRISAILRRVMLDDSEQSEVQMPQIPVNSSSANPAQAPLGKVPGSAPDLSPYRRLFD